jgi:transposase
MSGRQFEKSPLMAGFRYYRVSLRTPNSWNWRLKFLKVSGCNAEYTRFRKILAGEEVRSALHGRARSGNRELLRHDETQLVRSFSPPSYGWTPRLSQRAKRNLWYSQRTGGKLATKTKGHRPKIDNESLQFLPVPTPWPDANARLLGVGAGLPVQPLDRLASFSAGQFERFTLEWADGWLAHSLPDVDQVQQTQGRELHAGGLPIIVVEARHMRVSLSTMRNKTDRNDTRGIAQMMRLGWFRAVHVKNIEMQKMRTLLTNRKLLKRKLVDIENHVRGALRTYGLLVGAVGRGQYEARVRELIERTDIVFSTMIETMLAVCRAIFDGYAKLHRVLLQVVQHDQICRRLMTVPGVGPVASLSFKVGVDDPLRFTRSRTVGAHFGLTPRRHQSGTSIDYEGRISKQGDVSVREALCEAAASLLLRVRKCCIACLGPSDRQTIEHVVRDRSCRTQARRHPASHVDRRKRLQVGFGAKVTQRLKLKPAQ